MVISKFVVMFVSLFVFTFAMSANVKGQTASTQPTTGTTSTGTVGMTVREINFKGSRMLLIEKSGKEPLLIDPSGSAPTPPPAVPRGQSGHLGPVRKTRHAIGSKAEAYASAKEFKAALKANDDTAFADGVKASAVIAKLGGIPTAKDGWRVIKTTKTIPDAEMSGAKTDGSGLDSSTEDVEAGQWVLTNAPEDPQGGEHVKTVKLSCWNEFEHGIPTEKVAVETKHHRRVLHEGNTVEETTLVVPGRTIRTTRSVQGPDRYEASASCQRPSIAMVARQLVAQGYAPQVAMQMAPRIIQSAPQLFTQGGQSGITNNVTQNSAPQQQIANVTANGVAPVFVPATTRNVPASFRVAPTGQGVNNRAASLGQGRNNH